MMEENQQMQQQTLQPDQVLDQYVAKKNRNRKITLSFILAISLVLVVSILTLALFTVSIRPRFLLQAEVRGYESTISNDTNYYGQTNVNYDNIAKQFEDSFAMSLLTSIFTGQVGSYNIKETVTQFRKGEVASYLGCSDYMRVEFEYRQKVKNADDTDYVSYYGGQNLTFQEFYIALPEENKTQSVTIVIPCFGNYRPSGSDSFSDTISTVESITLNINVYGLRQLLAEL